MASESVDPSMTTQAPPLKSAALLDQATIQDFANSLRGDLILPDDPQYETARRVYNAMIDKYPAMIARCANAADVMTAVDFARSNDLLVALRGGGHNVAGFGTCDDGLVIDLSPMKGIRIDPQRRLAQVQGGATWGDLDHAGHGFGMATPGGIVSTTGVAGLTLGGGVGNLTRSFGLSSDNLTEVDIITADGQFRTANADENADLFWAVRGGGGNFGVVTSFTYRLHPLTMIYGGPVFYPIEKARDAMTFYREMLAKAPEALNAFFAFHLLPPAPFVPEHLHGAKVCGMVVCYSGPMEQAEEVVKPMRDFGPPLLDLMGPMPYPAIQTLFDALLPPGLYHYWKADFVHELTVGAIEAHVEYGAQVPTFQSGMHLYPIDGAAHRLGRTDTAFNYRDAKFVYNVVGVWPNPTDTPQNTRWVRAYSAALHPHSEPGGYVNFLGADEGEDRIRATYRENYDRLAALKKQYDPRNLFRVNQNIKPTTA